MTLPLWILEDLLHWLDALQAEEMQAAALANALPWLDPTERRRIIHAWEKAIQRARHDEAIKKVEVTVEDPKQARQWFAQLGARIEGVRKPSPD